MQLKIKNIPEVAPDKIDMQMINNFDDEEEGNAVSWEEYKAERKARAYSGNISLRIPKDLHRELVGVAKEQGVSLNQYCLYKLAR